MEFPLLSRGIKRFGEGLFVSPVYSARVVNTNAALVPERRTDPSMQSRP